MELHFAKGFFFQCAGYCWCCCMQPVVVCVRGRRDENSARIEITIVCIRSEWKQTRFAYITYGNSETCNKSLFEPIQMHRRYSMLIRFIESDSIVKPSHCLFELCMGTNSKQFAIDSIRSFLWKVVHLVECHHKYLIQWRKLAIQIWEMWKSLKSMEKNKTYSTFRLP